jgi:CTP:molybdopterin cytidylyltransferase MocA
MGTSKQLLPVGDRPAVVRCLEAIIAAGVRDITVVVAPAADAGVELIRPFPVAVVRNEHPGSDMAQSVRTGLTALSPAVTGVCVALADHPLVRPETYRTLIERHAREPEAILIPAHGDRRGHPTLFPRPLLEEINRLPTLRDILAVHTGRVRLVAVPDPGVALDMDTPAEYRQLLERLTNG